MTIINPNSIAGITSVTAQAGVMNFYKSDGTLGSLQLNGCNFNTTNGISTFNNLNVGGTLTYEDVKNVDSVGIISARTSIHVGAGISAVGIITGTSFRGDGSQLTGIGLVSDAQENTVAGTNAGDSFSGTSAINNTIYGYDAGTNITSGDKNTLVGHKAGDAITTGSFNEAFGGMALSALQTADSNTAVGYGACGSVTTGSNTGIGFETLNIASTGSNNTGCGFQALRLLGAGSYNVAYGYKSLWACGQSSGGNKNTAVGYRAGDGISSGENNICIGYYADASAATVSNEITIGDANINKLRVPGIGLTVTSEGLNLAGAAEFTGIVTASSYRGDGSALTGIASTEFVHAQTLAVVGISSISDVLKFPTNVSSTPSASGNVHIYRHDNQLKMCGGSGILFEEGGFSRWWVSSGALHPHSGTHNNLGNTTDRVGNAYIQTSVDLIDNAKLKIGTGDDLEIFHDASHSRIHNNTGLLLLECDGTGIEINSGASTENMAKFLKDGAVELYHNNSKKFETSSAGVTITGDLTVTGSAPGGASTGQLYVNAKNGSGSASDTGENVYAGYRSGSALASGAAENAFYGWEAGRYVTTGDYNTFLGPQAGENTTTSSNNTAIGSEAFRSNQTGASNTAVGKSALKATTGDNNVAIGHDAMVTNTSGAGNIAIGKLAFRSNSSGGENTIVGHQAAQVNTSNRNTCLGNNALYSNTTGYDNVVIGRYAMMLANSGNSTGTQGCTVIGTNAMYTGGGDGNIVIGSGAAYNFTTAHSNTIIGGAAFDANQGGLYTVAIGNNCLGAHNGSSENTAIGSQCGVSMTNGTENVLIGRECYGNATGGSYNVCLGKGALGGSTGNNPHSNVVIGRNAGRLITGAYNVVLGRAAGYDLTGSSNIIMGYEAAYNQTTAQENVVIGHECAKTNALTTGQNVFIGAHCAKNIHVSSGSVVAIGAYALENYDGYSGGSYGGWTVAIGPGAFNDLQNTRQSVAIGNQAGNKNNPTVGNLHEGANVFIGGGAGADGSTTSTAGVHIGRNSYSSGNNKTGANNISIGVRSLEQCTSGQHNVCIGTFAGYRITTANNTVAIGYLAGYAYDTSNATQTGDQCVFIGGYAHSSSTSVSYENVFGYDGTGKGSSTTFIRGSNGVYQQNNSSSWSTTSDIRIKKNVVDNNVGLDAIEKIRVRNFEYRTKEEIVDFDNPDAVHCDKPGTQLGVIAQEIQEHLPDVVELQSTGAYTVNPDNMTWYLVNAVKELSAEVKALKAQLNS